MIIYIISSTGWGDDRHIGFAATKEQAIMIALRAIFRHQASEYGTWKSVYNVDFTDSFRALMESGDFGGALDYWNEHREYFVEIVEKTIGAESVIVFDWRAALSG
jgi:hypothetical protein